MPSDVEISKLYERFRWWLFCLVAYSGLIVERLPVIISLKRYGELKRNSDNYQLALDAWERQKRINYELRQRFNEPEC